ncbi:hypothetical protein GWK47_046971 [Chionoecetes opilio]|uniref:Uncharacterized protein n=1 Tax=Chionoecetes opilio TaxID=41210 RepID=A0A8J5CTB1_CHIOP|nr:hypothetical protein GWK47_046971 [Chionoecetes opilio]
MNCGKYPRAVGVDDPCSPWPDVVSSPSLIPQHIAWRTPTVLSPLKFIFGRMAPLPADRHIPAYGTNPAVSPMSEYLSPLRDGLQAAQRVVGASPPPPTAIEPFSFWDAHFGGRPFLPALLQASPEMEGPFTIVRIPNAYQVCYATDTGDRTVHGADAKPYTEPPDPPPHVSSTSALPGGASSARFPHSPQTPLTIRFNCRH